MSYARCVFSSGFFFFLNSSHVGWDLLPSAMPARPARHTTRFHRDFHSAAFTGSEFSITQIPLEWHAYNKDAKDVNRVMPSQRAPLTLRALISLLLRTRVLPGKKIRQRWGGEQNKTHQRKSCLLRRKRVWQQGQGAAQVQWHSCA